MQYVDLKSIITPDGTELIEVNVIKALGEFFSSSKVFVRLSDIAGAGSDAIKGSFTLTPNATTTVVPVAGCLPSSVLCAPSPATHDAANDMATTSYVCEANQIRVTHANNPRLDRSFNFVLFP